MIDKKLSLVTIHDVNPSCAEKLQKTTDELKKLDIKYNLSIVPNYNKMYNLKDNTAFCDQISTLLQSDNVELTLHGLYHQINENIEDFDSQSKEEENRNKTRFRHSIFSSAAKTFNIYTPRMVFESSSYRSTKGF